MKGNSHSFFQLGKKEKKKTFVKFLVVWTRPSHLHPPPPRPFTKNYASKKQNVVSPLVISTSWCDSQLRGDAIWSRQTTNRTLPICSGDWSRPLWGGHEQQGTLCAPLYLNMLGQVGRMIDEIREAHMSDMFSDTHTLIAWRAWLSLYVESFVHKKRSIHLMFSAPSPLLFSPEVTLQL